LWLIHEVNESKRFYRLYQETFDRVPIKALEYEWFIANISQSKKTIYDALKRTIDIVGAALLLLPTAIVFPFIALAIKWEDKGDLFYQTTRVGQFDEPITIYKFRTKNGADAGADALNSQLVDTKVGKLLRKTRLDELPQLINVLRGDLSFIGPRPEMPALAEVYAKEIPFYNTRHFLKPGLSGWAQINDHDAPRGGVDIDRTRSKLSYDLYYLEQRSLVLDVQIALKTIATIVLRTGT
jgi:lipopolysaccharide/colanic/teichoic acid biosynthesis glycosyltransferase